MNINEGVRASHAWRKFQPPYGNERPSRGNGRAMAGWASYAFGVVSGSAGFLVLGHPAAALFALSLGLLAGAYLGLALHAEGGR